MLSTTVMAKQSITIRLDAPMLKAIDDVCDQERRTRTNTIEVLLEIALGERLSDNARVKPKERK
jgi:hypothetical protein